MEKPDEKYRRNTWWQDASGKRKFLMIGVDYLENPKDYLVDLWEVGKDKSKYIRLSIFESLIKENAMVHYSIEENYKSYLNN